MRVWWATRVSMSVTSAGSAGERGESDRGRGTFRPPRGSDPRPGRPQGFSVRQEASALRRSPIAFTVLVVALAPVPHAARAQVRADTSQRAAIVGTSESLLRGGEMGELLAVYVPRGSMEVQHQLDDARASDRAAATTVDGTRRLAADADGRTRIMREELQSNRVRYDVARKAGDPVATTELDAAYKRQSKELDYMTQVRDALRADADRMDADRVAAAAHIHALELELAVSRKHIELTTGKPGPTELSQYRLLLHDMLDAQRTAAERVRDAAERRRLAADRKLKQLESLMKLSEPPKR